MKKSVSQKIIEKGLTAVAEKSHRLEVLKVEYVPIDSIKPNSFNPNRVGEKELEILRASIIEDGFTDPIFAKSETREIIDGEHRWRMARDIGLEVVPVVFSDLTAEQMRISTLRHNRARGSEDADKVSALLRDLRELGALDWAQEALHLDDAALQRMMDDVSAPDALAADEFGEGWAPSLSPKNTDAQEGLRRDSASEQAIAVQAALEAKMQAAESLTEKAEVEKEFRKAIFRINLVFTDEQAELVRAALEPKPAQKLLALCLAEQARQPAGETAAE